MRCRFAYANIRHISWVSGTREKKRILEEYVSKFGSGHQESIITKKKGKLDINKPLHFATSSWKGMKPSSDKYYRVEELAIYNVITIVIQEYMAFSKTKLSSFHLINTDFSKMIPKLNVGSKLTFLHYASRDWTTKIKCRSTPIKFAWQMQSWLTLALIQEDLCDGWVENTLASSEMHTQP